MTKQEYLLALFDKLEPRFDEVAALKILVRHNVLDDTVLDTIYAFFESRVNQVLDETEKSKLAQATLILGRIRKMEAKDDDDESVERLIDSF
jgi:hypothetical protein